MHIFLAGWLKKAEMEIYMLPTGFCMWLVILFILAADAFSQGWYSRGGYIQCRDTEEGFLVCREDYVNNFCYGKERMWLKNPRERGFLDRGMAMMWFDRNLAYVRNLNSKCEYHGWSRFRQIDGSWTWVCFQNNRQMEDSGCRGFRKR